MAGEKILVVDDEKGIVETAKYNLEKAGFRVIVASDGETAIKRGRADRPDLIVLDLMLPKVSGLEVCRALKSDPVTKHIPIVMLTVMSDVTDKVVGLELGADDYMSKPFSPRELVARVNAVLRRYKGAAEERDGIFQTGELQVDWGRHIVTVEGTPVDLTSKEFGLLKALIEANGRLLTREGLLEMIWGYEESIDVETRTVDVHISKLRKKMGKAGPRILTVRNSGYRFVLDK
jgi:two-component system alkaline phosphatase synthesis response regulator PhoP